MNKAQFITSVEGKANFLKWGQLPVLEGTTGDIEQWHGIAHISTGDGTNLWNVWFYVDKTTGEATWQNFDTLTAEANVNQSKEAAILNYLKANFPAFKIKFIDTVNNFAEADVFIASGADLARNTIIVYKQGSNPITHKKVV